MHPDRLNLTVILEPGSSPAAAREMLHRLTPEEWALVLELSTAVLSLQEAHVDPNRVVTFQSVQREGRG